MKRYPTGRHNLYGEYPSGVGSWTVFGTLGIMTAVSDRVSERIHFAREVARDAGEVLRTWSDRLLTVSTKRGAVDLVTEADRASEEQIITRICNRFPEDGVLGEEGSSRTSRSGYLWVVDPLDGTTNFVHHLPHYMVSIGLSFEHARVGAACYGPALDEEFYAVSGKGAFQDGNRIRVSSTATLQDALLATGFPYNRADVIDELMPLVRRCLLTSRGLRRCGSAAYDLCNVARGHLDGFFETGLKPWDTAAGALLVTEAGGMLSDFDGKEYNDFGGFGQKTGRPSIVAANAHLHLPILHQIVGDA